MRRQQIKNKLMVECLNLTREEKLTALGRKLAWMLL